MMPWTTGSSSYCLAATSAMKRWRRAGSSHISWKARSLGSEYRYACHLMSPVCGSMSGCCPRLLLMAMVSSMVGSTVGGRNGLLVIDVLDFDDGAPARLDLQRGLETRAVEQVARRGKRHRGLTVE